MTILNTGAATGDVQDYAGGGPATATTPTPTPRSFRGHDVVRFC